MIPIGRNPVELCLSRSELYTSGGLIWIPLVFTKTGSGLCCRLMNERGRTGFTLGAIVVRFSIARGMLRLLTGDYLSRSAQAISFSYTRLGKPYLPSPDTLSFNVSHSHGMALFAFAHGMELGVDIEKHKAELPAADIAGHSFAPDEVRFVAEGQEGKPHERFFFLWSRKEAYAKARGEGLSLPLNGCSLLNGSQEDGFKICSFVPCLHFEGALAMRPGSSEIVFLDFDLSTFAI